MARTVPQSIRELCIAFPETEETISHDRPDYRVANRSFARLMINHHGDGRAGLWLSMPPGAQAVYTDLDPDAYFVPPYVGNKGWLGMDLSKGLSWNEVVSRVREAWEHAAPNHLTSSLEESPRVEAPDVELSPQDIDPLLAPRAEEVLAGLRERCNRLPEVTEDQQFGRPVWKAGKKTFAGIFHRNGRVHIDFWVGVEHQAMMTADPRFTIPKYTGHNGWINMDLENHLDWDEVEGMLKNSYRHFALKRMLNALETL